MLNPDAERQALPGKNTKALTTFLGPGYHIEFQDGPTNGFPPNGTTNEEILELVAQRLESLEGILHSDYNVWATTKIRDAIGDLEMRTRERQAQGIEGTMLTEPPEDATEPTV